MLKSFPSASKSFELVHVDVLSSVRILECLLLLEEYGIVLRETPTADCNFSCKQMEKALDF